MDDSKGESDSNAIVITYNRATGAFLPLMQTTGWETFPVLKIVENPHGNNSYLSDMQLGSDKFCSKIVVKGGSRTRTITLMQDTGKYKITAGETN